MIKAALFDVDGTLVDTRVWRGIVEHPDVSRWRVRRLYAGIWPYLVWARVNPAADVDFRARWVRGLAGLLKGWSVEALDALARRTADEVLADFWRTDALALVKEHKEQGHPVILVSTICSVILERIAERVGADAVIGTSFEVQNGVLTGRLVGSPCAGPGKVVAAEAYLAQHLPDTSLVMCAAYADSFSDVSMLAASGQPCAVYPDENLRAEAVKRGWRIFPPAEVK